MKTTKAITLGILAIFMMCSAMANEKDHDLLIQQIKYFKSNIGEQIVYPSDAKKDLVEGIVATSIYVNSNGQVRVTGINGHPTLIKDVKKTIGGNSTKPRIIVSK